MLKGRKGMDIKNVVFSIYCGFALLGIALLNSCAMTEEMRRIQAVEAEKARKAFRLAAYKLPVETKFLSKIVSAAA